MLHIFLSLHSFFQVNFSSQSACMMWKAWSHWSRARYCGRRAAACLEQELEPLSFSWAHKGERTVSHIPIAGLCAYFLGGREFSAEAGLNWLTGSGKICSDRLSPGSKTTTQLVRLSLYWRRPVQREISTNRCCSDYRGGIACILLYRWGFLQTWKEGGKWQASHFYRYD